MNAKYLCKQLTRYCPVGVTCTIIKIWTITPNDRSSEGSKGESDSCRVNVHRSESTYSKEDYSLAVANKAPLVFGCHLRGQIKCDLFVLAGEKSFSRRSYLPD